MTRGIKADGQIERTCLPLTEWPDVDQRLWAEAVTPAERLLDDGGQRSTLRPTTNKNVVKSYGRWLHWLLHSAQLDRDLSPGERITPDRVRAFAEALLADGNQPSTVSQRLGELLAAARALAPADEWEWLKVPARNLRNRATKKREKVLVLPYADQLVELGFDLMDASTAESRPGKRAVLFRDGLMIAFLALQPLRLKNLAYLVVGETLIKSGDRWTLAFTEEQTKTHRPIEGVWPATLDAALALYVRDIRPLLAARRRTSNKVAGQHLWLSAEGVPLSEKRIHNAIKIRTQDRFGYEIGPHRFRDAAATTLANLLPQNARAAAPLLHHSSFGPTEKHYIQSQVKAAQDKYLEAKEAVSRAAS